MTRICIVLGSIVLVIYFHYLYSRIQVKSRILLAQQLSQVIGIALLAQGVIGYLDGDLILPRRLMLLASSFTLISVFAWRVLYSMFLLRVMGGQRLLLVGGSMVLGEIACHLQEHPELGMRVAGVVDDCCATTPLRWGTKVVGPLTAVAEIARRMQPDRIVVGLSERRDRMPVADLLDLRFAGFPIEEAVTTYEAVCGRIRTAELRPAQFIFSGRLRTRKRTLMFRTANDFLLALVWGLIIV